MTTTEQTFEKQPLIRNDALPPSVLDDSKEHDDDFEFPPNVVPSENSVLFADPTEMTDDLEERGKKIFEDHYREFHASFSFKLRGEVVAQLFESFKNDKIQDESINLQHVAAMLRKELTTEQFRHFSQASYLANNAIPAARLRPSWNPNYTSASDYLSSDIPLLEDREEAHTAMAQYLEASTPKSEDALLLHAENLVREFLPEARLEVAKTIEGQIDELEQAKRELDARIEALGHKKAKLERREVPEEQDVPAEDEAEAQRAGLVSKLTQRAKSFAKSAA